MTSSKISRIAAIYDERSSKYDDSFHPLLAEDIVKWAGLQPGQSVLDLCCGTGLVSLPAKRAIGPQGKVIGVDISLKMQDEGRRKAAEAGLEITFIEGDVTKLTNQMLGLGNGDLFDVITCVTAFVLLDEPLKTLKHWATFLKPEGKLLFDVQNEHCNYPESMITKLIHEAGLSSDVVFSQYDINSVASLGGFIHTAGLQPTRVFETESYGKRRHEARDARKYFDSMIRYLHNGDIPDPKLKEDLVTRFEDKMHEAANSSGVIEEDIRLYVAIASKGI